MRVELSGGEQIEWKTFEGTSSGTFAEFRKEFIANYVSTQRVLSMRGQTIVRGADEVTEP